MDAVHDTVSLHATSGRAPYVGMQKLCGCGLHEAHMIHVCVCVCVFVRTGDMVGRVIVL